MAKSISFFHPHLYRVSFTIHMDHKALQLLKSLKSPEGQCDHSMGELEQNQYIIVH